MLLGILGLLVIVSFIVFIDLIGRKEGTTIVGIISRLDFAFVVVTSGD